MKPRFTNNNLILLSIRAKSICVSFIFVQRLHGSIKIKNPSRRANNKKASASWTINEILESCHDDHKKY